MSHPMSLEMQIANKKAEFRRKEVAERLFLLGRSDLATVVLASPIHRGRVRLNISEKDKDPVLRACNELGYRTYNKKI